MLLHYFDHGPLLLGKAIAISFLELSILLLELFLEFVFFLGQFHLLFDKFCNLVTTNFSVLFN